MIFQRRDDRAWEYLSIALDSTNFDTNDPVIAIASIDLKFPLSLLYENIDFPDSQSANQTNTGETNAL